MEPQSSRGTLPHLAVIYILVMQHLPWLVVHGALAFRLALAGATLLGLALAWIGPRARARWEARRARAKLGEDITTALEVGATVTVVGTLEASGAGCARFEDGSPAAAASITFARGALDRDGPWATAVVARAETLAVITAVERFELVGEVEVVAGSREARPGAALLRLAPAVRSRAAAGSQRAAAAYAARAVALRSIAHGEAVRIRGVLRREPVTSESSTYRDTRARWTLVGEEDPGVPAERGPLPLPLAFEGPPRVSGPSWSRLCQGAGAGALLFVGMASLTGEIAARLASSPGPVGRAAGAVLLAAVSPLHRERAISMLQATLSLRCLDDYSRGHVEQEVAIAELQGDCDGAASALIRHGQLDRAAHAAEACGAPKVAARAHYLRGRFDLGSDAFELARARRSGQDFTPLPGPALADAIFGVRLHLFAGRLDRAAEEARRAAREAQRIDDATLPAHPAPRRARILGCLADSLSARQDPRRLPALIREGEAGARECGWLLADAHRAEARCPLEGSSDEIGWSLYVEDRLERADAAFLKEQCAGTHTPDPPVLDHPSRLFGELGEISPMGPPAVIERLLDGLTARGGPPCVARGQLAAASAAFAALAGEHREARRFAEQAQADFPPGSDRGERALVLRAAVELYAGDAAQARVLLASLPESAPDVRALRWMADVRQKGDLALLSAPQERLGTILHAPQRVEPWSITAQGDGARLAAWLQRHDADGIGAYLILAAPHLHRGRAALLEWFRWGDKSECWSCAPSLVLFDVASRKEAVEILGDPNLAGELRAIAQAFHHAQLTREIAVPLAVLAAL